MTDNLFPGDDLEIRPAVASDADDIFDLITHLAWSTGHPELVTSKPADYLAMGFEEPPAFFALIAERAGQPIGLSLYFYTFSSWRGERGVYLQDLVVTDNERGSGLGRQLIAETARRASLDGATHLRLSVATDNHHAMGFYQEVGLSPADEERLFEADGKAFTRLAGTA